MIVSNAEGDSLQCQVGEAYQAPAKYALCGCGHSRKGPPATAPMPRSASTGLKRPARRPSNASWSLGKTPRKAERHSRSGRLMESLDTSIEIGCKSVNQFGSKAAV